MSMKTFSHTEAMTAPNIPPDCNAEDEVFCDDPTHRNEHGDHDDPIPPEAAEKAREICVEMERRMKALGLVTTAHYDTGQDLIAAALAEERRRGYEKGLQDGGCEYCTVDPGLVEAMKRRALLKDGGREEPK